MMDETGANEKIPDNSDDVLSERAFDYSKAKPNRFVSPAIGGLPVQTMPLELAEGHLAEIIERLSPGEEVVLTRDEKPIATLRSAPPAANPPRFGTLKGTILQIAPDFDDIPEGFEDYLP